MEFWRWRHRGATFLKTRGLTVQGSQPWHNLLFSGDSDITVRPSLPLDHPSALQGGHKVIVARRRPMVDHAPARYQAQKLVQGEAVGLCPLNWLASRLLGGGKGKGSCGTTANTNVLAGHGPVRGRVPEGTTIPSTAARGQHPARNSR